MKKTLLLGIACLVMSHGNAHTGSKYANNESSHTGEKPVETSLTNTIAQDDGYTINFEANAPSTSALDDNLMLSGDACLDWVSPSPTEGYTNFNTEFDGAPCDDGTGCPFNEITGFEVWKSEAYDIADVQAGGVYTFSHCNGPGAGSWVPEYTIIAPSGNVDAFGAGDGDGCSITWTASEDGNYLIVINEAGNCGTDEMVDNGYPALTCSGGPSCAPAGDCIAGTIEDTTPLELCVNEEGVFSVGGTESIPAGHGYAIYFSPTTGTGALGGAFHLTGVTLPFTFDANLGGVLSGNGFPLFEGEWEVYGSVYENVDEPADTECSLTDESILVDFLPMEDPSCDVGNALCADATPVGVGLHTYDDIFGDGASDVCYAEAFGARWFVFTPESDGMVTVKACGGVDTRLSIFTGTCDDFSCYASNDDDDDTDCEPGGFASSVTDLPVTEGVDYYIMWDDNWSTDGSDWEISFTAAPECDAPVATAAIDFSNCPSPEFSVNVDLTSLGDAGSVDIVENVNGGGETVIHDDVTALQEYAMGPYDMGDEVNVTVLHNDDPACNIDLGSFTAENCPPVNDLCGDAIPISCGESLEGTNVDATPYYDTCVGDTLAGGVWYTFLGENSDDPDAPAGTAGDQVTLSTCDDADYDTKIDVFTGDCGDLVCVGGNDDGDGCAGFTSEANISTVVGNTYYVYVSGYADVSSGIFNLSMTCAPACLPTPTNDLCEDAETLTVAETGTGTPTAGTNVCATSSLENPSCDQFATIQDVWFTFNSGDETGALLVADTVTMSGMGVVVYEGTCGGEEVFCSADFTDPAIVDLNTDTDYFIQVYTNGSGGAGTFEIMVETLPEAPANDDCANAVAIECGSTTTGSTLFATNGDAPAMCDDFDLSTAPGLWYAIDGFDGTMIASLCGSAFDSKMGVFSGSCGDLVCIAGEDDDFDNCNSADPYINWAGTEGETYYIYVTGYGDNSGAFELVVECEEETDEPCTEWAAPATGGWTDFNDNFGGAPCNDGDGCPFLEIDAFEVYQSEAYAMANVVEGGSYTFSHCNGTSGSWIPDYTIIAPSGAIDAFGAGDGDGCSITWTASESGEYLIVINEAGACGVGGSTDNGFPAITCNDTPICPDPPANDDCADAVDVTPGVHDFTTLFATTDGPDQPDSDCDDTFESNVNQDVWYEYTASCDGIASVSTCNTADFDTRIAIYPGGECPPDGASLIACNDDGVDSLGVDCGGFTSVVEWDISDGTTYLIRIGGYSDASSGSGTFELSDDCGTSVDDLSTANFSVFPNPNNGQFAIEFAGENGMAQIDVLDVSGKTVLSEQRMMTEGARMDIDLGDVNGLYFVRMTMDQDTKVLKVIVQ